MAVVVLPPQDSLREGVSHRRPLASPPRSKPRRNTAVNNNSTPQTGYGRRKQWSPASSPSPPQSRPNNNEAKSNRAKSPVAPGQIRILKRGEDLTPTKPPKSETTPVKNQETKIERANSDPVSSTRVRKIAEPSPAPIRNLFVDGFYAGSAFQTSPPPSSLPVPAFCTKSIGPCAVAAKTTVEDVVAVDLRRMLRIQA